MVIQGWVRSKIKTKALQGTLQKKKKQQTQKGRSKQCVKKGLGPQAAKKSRVLKFEGKMYTDVQSFCIDHTPASKRTVKKKVQRGAKRKGSKIR